MKLNSGRLSFTSIHMLMNNLKFFMVICLFVFMLLLSSCAEETKIQLGNNSGNIINHGMIVSDNESIYYVVIDGPDKGLFSMTLNGENVKKLSDDKVEYLNVLDGWLYYRKISSDTNHNGGIYKMRVDGTNEERLSSDEGFYINVINDWIYYINWSYDTSVCKIKTDGTKAQVIYQGHFEDLTADDKWLYFKELGPDGMFYRGYPDGSKMQKLSSDKQWAPMVLDNWIYYRNDSKGYDIYRMKTNGSGVQTLIANQSVYNSFIVHNGWIYIADDVYGLMRVGIYGGKQETIYKGMVLDVGVANNYVFFRSNEQDKYGHDIGKTYLINIDNGNKIIHIY